MLFYVITENIKLNRRFFLIVLSIEETINVLVFYWCFNEKESIVQICYYVF